MINTFGSVIKKESDFFIFLTEGESSCYLARIISLEDTRQLERLSSNPKYRYKLDYPMFNYTILQTQKFRDRAANYTFKEDSINDFDSTDILVESSDLQKLKEDILSSNSVANELRIKVEAINITSPT